ncbi:MAG: endonuclease III [Ignavibacteriales bacterium]|nr:endonuclease III [Ignavibacteriales bacterium]
MEKDKALTIIQILKNTYIEVKPELIFSSAFELLIATILSAQCTDKRVNIVTKVLFKKYKKPEDYLQVKSEELEKDIFSTGFYKQKAKSIKAVCEALISDFNSKVPENFDKLVGLPGIGRKSASVIASNWFNIPSIAVDTHVKRLSNLIGFIDSNNPEKIEQRLKELIPEKLWIDTSLLLSKHGRKICIARKPKCKECVINKLCNSAFK